MYFIEIIEIMTSRGTRHEESSYSSSNVVRTLHPSRPLSPPQKNVEYNNNNLGKFSKCSPIFCYKPLNWQFLSSNSNIFLILITLFSADNLLGDLQTTVTRTAEHLNSANSSKSRDVHFLSPSNSTTVVEERSSSPAGVCSKFF